jgi:CMP-N-acetylneuraminic acid synthetase
VDAAARHAVAAVDAAGRHATIVVLYANVPVRPTTLIDDAVAMLDTTGAHSVQSYEPVGKHHPWWTATLDAQTGAAAGFDGGALNRGVHRRQDLPPAYVPSGGVIALTRAALMLDIVDAPPGPHAFFGTDRRGVVHAAGDVVDIDDAFDAVIAEAMLMRRCQATPASPRDECGHHKSTTDEEAA